jgi:hypothetical protein
VADISDDPLTGRELEALRGLLALAKQLAAAKEAPDFAEAPQPLPTAPAEQDIATSAVRAKAAQPAPDLSVHLRAILKAVEGSAVGSDGGTTAKIFPEVLTPRECAALRRCSVRKLDRERADGRGCPYIRIDSRIFYRRQDVDRFMATHVRGLHEANAFSDPAPAQRRRPRRSEK